MNKKIQALNFITTNNNTYVDIGKGSNFIADTLKLALGNKKAFIRDKRKTEKIIKGYVGQKKEITYFLTIYDFIKVKAFQYSERFYKIFNENHVTILEENTPLDPSQKNAFQFNSKQNVIRKIEPNNNEDLSRKNIIFTIDKAPKATSLDTLENNIPSRMIVEVDNQKYIQIYKNELLKFKDEKKYTIRDGSIKPTSSPNGLNLVSFHKFALNWVKNTPNDNMYIFSPEKNIPKNYPGIQTLKYSSKTDNFYWDDIQGKANSICAIHMNKIWSTEPPVENEIAIYYPYNEKNWIKATNQDQALKKGIPWTSYKIAQILNYLPEYTFEQNLWK